MEPIGDWIDLAPWRSRHVALIAVLPDGSTEQAFNIGTKRALLQREAVVLVAVWAGQWAVTGREFGPGEREKVLAALG